MPHRLSLPQLNHHFDIKHVAKDFHKIGIDDIEVYKLAVTQQRIILTKNSKDFIPLLGTMEDYGIIAIPPYWKSEFLDTKLTSLLKKQNPSYFKIKCINITKSEKDSDV